MKKVLSMMLTLTMLSSTAAMCFADQGMETNAFDVSVIDIDVKNELNHEDEKDYQKQELMENLDAIQNDTSLTFKDKVVRCWEYVKAFVKKHYIKIGLVTGAIALATVVLVFGSDVAGYIKGWFTESDLVGREDHERVNKAKEAFSPIFAKMNAVLSMEDSEIVAMQLLREDELRIRKFERAFWEYGGTDILVDHLYKDLLNYANADLVALIKLKENNEIVDEFLAATGCLKEYEAERRYLSAKEAFAPVYGKINAILNMDDSKIVVNVQLSEQDKVAIEKFEHAFREYYNMIEKDVMDVELMDKALTDYATDELLEIIRSWGNNNIVDEFLGAMEL